MTRVISKDIVDLLNKTPDEMAAWNQQVIEIETEKAPEIITLNKQLASILEETEETTGNKIIILNELLPRIKQLNQYLTKLEVEKASEVVGLNRKISNLEVEKAKKIAALNQQVMKAKKDEKKAELNEELAKIEAAKDEAIATLKQQVTKIETDVVPKITELRQQIAKISDALPDITLEKSELSKQITAKDKEIAVIATKLNKQSKERLIKKVTEIININKNLKRLDIEKAGLNQKLAEIEAAKDEAIASLTSKVTKKVTEIVSKKDEAIAIKVEEIKKQLPDITFEIVTLNQQLPKIVSEITELLQTLKKIASEKELSKITFNEKIKQMETEKDKEIASLKQQKIDIKQLSETVSKKDKEIADEKNNFDEQEKIYNEKLTIEKTKTKTQIGEIVLAQASVIATKIEEFKKQLPDIASEVMLRITGLNQQLSEIVSEIVSETARLGQKVEAIAVKPVEKIENLNQQLVKKIEYEKAKINNQLAKLNLEADEQELIASLKQQIGAKKGLKDHIVEIVLYQAFVVETKMEVFKQRLPKIVSEITRLYQHQRIKQVDTKKIEKIEKFIKQEMNKIASEVVSIAELNQQITAKDEEIADVKVKLIEVLKGLITHKKETSIDFCLESIRKKIGNNVSEPSIISESNSDESKPWYKDAQIGFTSFFNRTLRSGQESLGSFINRTKTKFRGFADDWSLEKCKSTKKDLEAEIKKLEGQRLNKIWNGLWVCLTLGCYNKNARIDRKIAKRKVKCDELEIKISKSEETSKENEPQPSTSATVQNNFLSKDVARINAGDHNNASSYSKGNAHCSAGGV